MKKRTRPNRLVGFVNSNIKPSQTQRCGRRQGYASQPTQQSFFIKAPHVQQQGWRSTKTHNISCLRDRITKRTACNSQNQPTRTNRLRDRTATQRKKKRKRNFSFCSAIATKQTSINSKNEIIDSSLVIKQSNLLLARRFQSISTRINHKLSLPHAEREKMCFCGVEPQTAQHPNVKEEENYPTVADSSLTRHAHWANPLTHSLAQELKQE